MGQDIDQCHFKKYDFIEFNRRLKDETALLKEMFEEEALESDKTIAGYELETWLVNKDGLPSSSNERFLSSLNNPEVVSELAQFNIEINGPPEVLSGNALSKMEADITERWKACTANAQKMNLDMVSIGILPTLQNSDLGLANMSKAKRYRALNEQVLRLREGEPIQLNIQGNDHLELSHQDVMLEAAATSFQIHMQVNPAEAAHYYNLSKIISAPMLAVSANSPFLFGHELWEESRIPLFEQAVAVGGTAYCRRVTFGVRYLQQSIFEIFEANMERYPILLPLAMDSEREKMKHLGLHNGTIWRWSRPIIGVNDKGKAHVRIEHRAIAAGPSQVDQVANMAFFYGLITGMAGDKKWIHEIPHEKALNNFYNAAKNGMHCDVFWKGNKKSNLRKLCIEDLLPKAARGLKQLNIDQEEAESYLNIIHDRLKTAQTGSAWQRAWVEKYGKGWSHLTLDYAEKQSENIPVHKWEV